MTRVSTHFIAAFGAVIITIVSLQAVTSVPQAQLVVIDTRTLA